MAKSKLSPFSTSSFLLKSRLRKIAYKSYFKRRNISGKNQNQPEADIGVDFLGSVAFPSFAASFSEAVNNPEKPEVQLFCVKVHSGPRTAVFCKSCRGRVCEFIGVVCSGDA